ncbi:hypothetical protein VTI74DRAFT_6435 [Chaetomium olivicolor]
MALPIPRPSMPSFISQALSSSIAYLRDKLGSLTHGTSIAIARPAILSLLSSIEVGTLVLLDEPHGERLVFGQPLPYGQPNNPDNLSSQGNASALAKCNANTNPLHPNASPPVATLTVKSSTFYPRLLLLADMGFADSYLLCEVECPDLTAFFTLFIRNRARLNNGTTRASTLLSAFSSLLPARTRPTNTLPNAPRHVQAHYDISNAMFAAFLSRDMTYSCPVWELNSSTITTTTATTAPGASTRKDLDGEEEETLEQAQMRKLQRFIDGLRIKRTDHVLEIGSGWGSFAIEAARQTGCKVTTVTLSKEQKGWVEERVRTEGLEGRVEVLLRDYREVEAPKGGFDKVVSIEMIEAVGEAFLGTYFGCVNSLLKREGGIAMFQCITMPEGRHGAYSRREDFINRYIFPGGYLPSITQLLNHISTASKGTLIVERVENIGGHYVRTLRLWKEQFLVNFEDKIRPALLREHPDMTDEGIEVFRRKWEYYFTYCEAGFSTKTLGDVVITVGREGAMELMEGIPL